jgi:Rieske 2Fe-2S family protein
VHYYAIFPQILLSLHPDYVMCHTLWPVHAAETRVVCEWLFDPNASGQPGFDTQDAVNFWDLTNHQDWHVCELSQLGVSSRRYTPSPYASTESLLAAFDQEYLRSLA